jgi:hypothetical protein
MGHITAMTLSPNAPLAVLSTPDLVGAPAPSGGAVLLRVLEAAQRMVAYCDNAAVGAAEDPALDIIGIPAPRLSRALRDLVSSVHDMNTAMTGEAACAALAALHRVPAGRATAGAGANRPARTRRAVAEAAA